MSLGRKIRAFTLVELLVVIGIIALLISILLPVLTKAREQALILACSAQMKDFGNAIQMYSQYNQGYFPGPCPGQVRAGYWQNSQFITEYISHYMGFQQPDATHGTDGNHPIFIPNLYCPGYRAKDSGAALNGVQWTYLMYEWDPYPWFGYPNDKYFALYFTTHPKITTGPYTGYVMPMKQSQVFGGSEMPIMGDIDNGEVMFDSGAPVSGVDEYPNHGGKPEIKYGLLNTTNSAGGIYSAFYIITNPAAATNPPRNYLYADGHVVTIRRSGPAIPKDLQRYQGKGAVPAGILPPN